MDPLYTMIQEATTTVEKQLAIEDAGWVNLSGIGVFVVDANTRIRYLQRSRLHFWKDPLAHQAIRIWTDYTFGSGITFKAKDDTAAKVLAAFWDAKENKAILSPRGQRKLSDKLLVDGEIFYALFLGPDGNCIIRTIDPLEIVEIVTNPDDIEDVRYYKRSWMTSQGAVKEGIYRSVTNKKNLFCLDNYGLSVVANEDALVGHLTYNTISQRGNPLLLPALDWIDYYRRFLASRIAIMLALAKFAWKAKVKGGQTAVDRVKATLQGEAPASASTLYENEGLDTTPIKTETGAQGAYQDGKMLMHQICAAVGIPEQYFGDIGSGNWATARTVELPLEKQFGSYQASWGGTFQEINECVLEHNNIPPDKWYVDIDFPPIGADEASQIATALGQILTACPELGALDEVKQVALMALGINDTAEVLAQLPEESTGAQEARLIRALKDLREALKGGNIK